MKEMKKCYYLRKVKKRWVTGAITFFGASVVALNLTNSDAYAQENAQLATPISSWRANSPEQIKARIIKEKEIKIDRGDTLWAISMNLGPDSNRFVRELAKSLMINLEKGEELHLRVGCTIKCFADGTVAGYDPNGKELGRTSSLPSPLPSWIPKEGSAPLANNQGASNVKETPQSGKQSKTTTSGRSASSKSHIKNNNQVVPPRTTALPNETVPSSTPTIPASTTGASSASSHSSSSSAPAPGTSGHNHRRTRRPGIDLGTSDSSSYASSTSESTDTSSTSESTNTSSTSESTDTSSDEMRTSRHLVRSAHSALHSSARARRRSATTRSVTGGGGYYYDDEF